MNCMQHWQLKLAELKPHVVITHSYALGRQVPNADCVFSRMFDSSNQLSTFTDITQRENSGELTASSDIFLVPDGHHTSQRRTCVMGLWSADLSISAANLIILLGIPTVVKVSRIAVPGPTILSS